MTQGTLKTLRFITPGIIILIYMHLLGKFTGAWSFIVPLNLKEMAYTAPAVIMAAIYYCTPLRDIANREFFEDVSENIRSKLVNISGLKDDPQVYTWKKLRGVFYHLVDNDKSLSIKSEIAYHNGFIWTTLADIKAISLIFAVFALALSVFNIESGFWSFIFFVLATTISHIASGPVTKMQKSIGDQQIEIIEHHHLEKLKNKLGEIRERANKSSNQ